MASNTELCGQSADERPLAIDLFCGLGGWTDGLLAENFRVIGFDVERHDYGDGAKYPAQLVLQDVMTIHGRQFKDAALIVASPPCQEYSYMAMPWSIAKAKAAEYRNGTRDVVDLTALFDACFRIQREAIEAAGHFIPLVVENVRGAIPWVGRSRWNFGSFHLWGDVPALMPMTKRVVMKAGVAHRADGTTNFHGDKNYGQKVPGFRFDGSGKSFQSESVKVAGLNWSNYGKPGYKAEAFNTTAEKRLRVSDGGCKGFTPNGGPLGKNELGRKRGSKSKARKAASAAIAKIPFPLAQHIARYWMPQQVAA